MNLAEMLAMADKATEGVELSNNKEFELLPPGEYSAAITGASLKDSKRANPSNPSEFGKLIEIEATITDGQYQGRKVRFRNNILVYPKTMSDQDVRGAQTAMKIGATDRKVLLDSIGKVSITQAEELIGATCRLKLVIGLWDGKQRNEVKSVMSSSASSKSAPSFAPSAPVQQATESSSRPKMPWEK